MSSKICRKFQYLSAWVMDVLSEAMERKLPCSEETVTETILLKLSRYTGTDFGVNSFTKKEESINGADWEIWFCNGTHGISIRLQAKRLYENGKYGAFKRGNSKQRKNLKKKAKEVGAIPLYLFYNHDRFSPSSSWACVQNKVCRQSDWGCAVAPLCAIPYKGQPKIDEIKAMFPWHYLVCPSKNSNEKSLGLVDLVAKKLEKICGGHADQKEEKPKWVRQLERLSEGDSEQDMPPQEDSRTRREQPSDSDSEQDPSSQLEKYLTQKQLGGLLVIRLRE
jgi:hypothetical protein